MAGLGTPMGAQQPMADQTGGMGAQDDEETGEPATEQEQQAYEQFVNAALSIIYPQGSEQVSPQILDDLKGNIDPKVAALFQNAQPQLTGQPADNVAVVTVTLVLMVDAQLGFLEKGMAQQQQGAQPTPQQPQSPAEEQGEPIDYYAVVLHAARAITEELIEVSEAAKLHDFNEQDIEQTWARAMDLYRVASENMGAPGYDKQGLTNAFADLLVADKQGQLGNVLPGLPGGAPMQGKGA